MPIAVDLLGVDGPVAEIGGVLEEAIRRLDVGVNRMLRVERRDLIVRRLEPVVRRVRDRAREIGGSRVRRAAVSPEERIVVCVVEPPRLVPDSVRSLVARDVGGPMAERRANRFGLFGELPIAWMARAGADGERADEDEASPLVHAG